MFSFIQQQNSFELVRQRTNVGVQAAVSESKQNAETDTGNIACEMHTYGTHAITIVLGSLIFSYNLTSEWLWTCTKTTYTGESDITMALSVYKNNVHWGTTSGRVVQKPPRVPEPDNGGIRGFGVNSRCHMVDVEVPARCKFELSAISVRFGVFVCLLACSVVICEGRKLRTWICIPQSVLVSMCMFVCCSMLYFVLWRDVTQISTWMNGFCERRKLGTWY